MQRDEILELLKRYNTEQCTEAEKAFIEDWYLQYEADIEDLNTEQRTQDLQKIWANLQLSQDIKKTTVLWRKIGVAASVLILLTVGLFFMVKQKRSKANLVTQADVLPGGNKAVLKLSNGKSIVLSDDVDGKIVNQQDLVVRKSPGGLLQYLTASLTNAGGSPKFDTLFTPAGGTFKLKLSDGSTVQLNAESALRYPESFTNKERTVELLKGEAYFEVVHNVSKPFKVITGRQVTEDIGTHFNINAYGDDADVQTTLIEGAVKIKGGGKDQRVLKPGQQANFMSYGDRYTVKAVDTDDIIAWKDGLFLFDNTELSNVMRQLSRWYNVKVTYRGARPTENYTGEARRSVNLSAVLKMLQTTGNVKFEINDGNIIVENKYSPNSGSMAK